MNFGFLVFPDFEELDLIGPWEIIGFWKKIAQVAGEQTAGQVQLAVEYYPSNKLYGEFHIQEKAPGYAKR